MYVLTAADFKYAFRVFSRQKRFFVIAVLLLSLGCGPNTAIFALIDAIFLSTLPVPHPKQLFFVKEVGKSSDDPAFSYPEFGRLRSTLPITASIAALTPPSSFYVAPQDEQPVPALGQLVSGNFFSVLAIKPFAGRLLTERDEDGSTVAVISYALLQRRFSGNLNVVGKPLIVNRIPFTIVGVAPPDFKGLHPGRSISFWVPAQAQSLLSYKERFISRGGNPSLPFVGQENIFWIELVARAADSGAVMQVTAKINKDRLAAQASYHHDQPENKAQVELESASRGFARLRQRFLHPMAVLMAAVLLVLATTCANIAILLIVRGRSRAKEVAIRLSLGASRLHIGRQLLVESITLTFFAGVLGLVLYQWVGNLLLWISAGFLLPFQYGLVPNAHVLMYCALTILTTGMAMGLVPALQCSKIELVPALQLKSRMMAATSLKNSRWSLTRSLVAIQIALCLAMFAQAAAFYRTLAEIDEVNPGFDRNHLVSVWFDAVAGGYQQDRFKELYDRLNTRLRALPGVDGVAFSTCGIYSGCRDSSIIYTAGKSSLPSGVKHAQENWVDVSYFRTVGIQLSDGRFFTASDDGSAPSVAIVNKTFAGHYLDGNNPVGQFLGFQADRIHDIQIVGVVNDAFVNGLREPVPPLIYYPLAQSDRPAQLIDIHTAAFASSATAAEIRRAIKEIDAHIPVVHAVPLAELLRVDISDERGVARLIGMFALLVLILSCLGAYGAASFATDQRSMEFGIRLALGSSRVNILRLALSEVLKIVLVGIPLGLVGAFTAVQVASRLFPGVTAPYSLALLGMTILLGVIIMAAGVLPAWRASRLDPAATLHAE
jgi:predicted permease